MLWKKPVLPACARVKIDLYFENERGLVATVHLKNLKKLPSFRSEKEMTDAVSSYLPAEGGPWKPMTSEDVSDHLAGLAEEDGAS